MNTEPSKTLVDEKHPLQRKIFLLRNGEQFILSIYIVNHKLLNESYLNLQNPTLQHFWHITFPWISLILKNSNYAAYQHYTSEIWQITWTISAVESSFKYTNSFYVKYTGDNRGKILGHSRNDKLSVKWNLSLYHST